MLRSLLFETGFSTNKRNIPTFCVWQRWLEIQNQNIYKHIVARSKWCMTVEIVVCTEKRNAHSSACGFFLANNVCQFRRRYNSMPSNNLWSMSFLRSSIVARGAPGEYRMKACRAWIRFRWAKKALVHKWNWEYRNTFFHHFMGNSIRFEMTDITETP